MNKNEEERDKKYHRMTEEPVEKLICKMSVQTILAMLVTAIYSMADTFFVGKIDTASTAAVGVVFSAMSLIQALGFLYGHGSGNYISRMLGKKEEVLASEMAATGLAVGFATGILLMILGLLFLRPLTIFLGATEGIVTETQSYLRIILYGAPFMIGALTLNNQYRLQGNAGLGTLGIMTGAIVNCILDPILIFGFHMGLRGAGYATTIGQIIGFLVLLYVSQRKGNIEIHSKNCKFSFRLLKEMHQGGMPNLCRQGIASIAMALLNRAAGIYGEEAIAAFTIVNRVAAIVGALMIGFGHGFQPVCGFNFGAEKYERVKKAFYFVVKVSTIYAFISAVLMEAAAPFLIRIFRDDREVIQLGVKILRIQAVSFPVLAWVTMIGMFLQNTSQFKKATLLTSARQGTVFLPLILTLPIFFGMNGIIAVQPVADAITFLISLPVGLKALKHLDIICLHHSAS